MNPQRAVPYLCFVLLIAAGIVHSAWATRHDSFTLDEPWHIVAGVSYYREGSLRLNPEHPPLVKLAVAPWVEAGWFRFPPPGRIIDKIEERKYADGAMFSHNDADRVQQASRRGMFWFHGVLFFVFAVALSAEAGPLITSLVLAFLLFDPTVAAHLPVVMTDLPLALFGGISLVLVARLIRLWTWPAAAMLGVALGLTLAAKHSALIILSILPLLPLAAGVASRQRRRILQALFAAVLPVAVLWASYGFRYWEHRPGEDWFNRPLEKKIDDVRSPGWKQGLKMAAAAHIVPRAYLWGLADVVRAGIDGRMDSALVFGKIYIGRAPWHSMPATVLSKLPPAALGLALLALFAVWRSWRERRWFSVESVAWISGTWMLLVLIRSGTVYGGVRHALFLWMMLAIAAAAATALLWRESRRLMRMGLAGLWVVFAVQAAPIERPWEYHNFLAGGTENAHLNFANEGLDLSQRSREIAAYYHRELKPRGIKPYIFYWISDEEWKYRGVEYSRIREAPSEVITGVIIAGPGDLAPGPEQLFAPLRAVKPKYRIGTVQVFDGPVPLPKARAASLALHAASKLYSAKPEVDTAVKLLDEAARLAPDVAAIQIELGNVRMMRGEKDLALAAFRAARDGSGVDETLRRLLDAHILAVAAARDAQSGPYFRNPRLE